MGLYIVSELLKDFGAMVSLSEEKIYMEISINLLLNFGGLM
ncbi:hypothetical protein [Anaerococcus obesiensis]|nr:hypothetical protein [Anaerococcus obesiensis]